MATINGTNGNDSLVGTDGDDTILAEAGRDLIALSGGNDFVDGGADFDTLGADLSFAPESGPRVYTLSADRLFDSSGAIDTTFVNIEQVSISIVDSENLGASIDASAFTGPILSIQTGDGDDLIIGSALDDTIIPGLGQNTIDGGLGNDIAVFRCDNVASPDGVTIDISDPTTISTIY